jgi:hypothetical protein
MLSATPVNNRFFDLYNQLKLACEGEPDIINEKLNLKKDRDMSKYSNLLQNALQSIIQTKEEKDIDSLFRQGGTTALDNAIKGLDDFELIAFLVIRGNE